MRLYKVTSSGTCYEALTDCNGCLDASPVDATAARPLTCPTRICTSSDTLTAAAMSTYDYDVTDLPKVIDVSTFITNPQSLTLDLVRVGNGTHTDF